MTIFPDENEAILFEGNSLRFHKLTGFIEDDVPISQADNGTPSTQTLHFATSLGELMYTSRK